MRAGRFHRGVVFIPYLLPVAVVGVLFGQILTLHGLLNSLARRRSASARLPSDWLGNPDYALSSLIGVIVWKELGFGVIIFLARLFALPTEVYEAARADGAGWWRTHWHVSLPGLRPIILFYLVIEGITLLSWVFNYVFVMTGGGPGDATGVIETYVYDNLITYRLTWLAASAAIDRARHRRRPGGGRPDHPAHHRLRGRPDAGGTLGRGARHAIPGAGHAERAPAGLRDDLVGVPHAGAQCIDQPLGFPTEPDAARLPDRAQRPVPALAPELVHRSRGGSVVICMLFASMAAFGLVRFDFWGRDLVLGIDDRADGRCRRSCSLIPLFSLGRRAEPDQHVPARDRDLHRPHAAVLDLHAVGVLPHDPSARCSRRPRSTGRTRCRSSCAS